MAPITKIALFTLISSALALEASEKVAKLGRSADSIADLHPNDDDSSSISARDVILSRNLFARAGTQFITGACTSDADCASACCGFKSGKCAGPVVAQERDGGCGFGNAQPNADAAIALGFNPSNAPAASQAASTAVAAQAASTSTAAAGANQAAAGNGAGKQFITGACTSDADCASGCCGFKSGKCAGAVVAQERDGGCGFGDATPNASAAIALGFQPTSAAAATQAQAQAQATGTASASSAGANQAAAGNGAGKQFITGACTSDADCASGCCGFKSGKCAGAVVAQERDGGCGFGDATPNASAAIALGFQPTAAAKA